MNKLVFFLLLVLTIHGFSQSKKINGISVVASNVSLEKKHVIPLQKIKANYVTLMPFGFISDLETPNIIFNSKRQWFGETEEGIRQYTQKLQKEHFKIMLKPHIWVHHGVYTGFIKMDAEKKWKILEDSYRKYILFYAKLANTLNIDIFCIGVELEQFVKQRPLFWIDLIKQIRINYKGKITYAANWDEYKRVSFWNELDYIGIDAYFPLSKLKTPKVKELQKSWKTHKKEIYQLQQKFNKPVLFTEFGYRSVDFAAKEPWISTRNKQSVNLGAQNNALKAIYLEFWKENWFSGGFLWKWFLNYKKGGGVNNNLFTPQNKPAEKTIKTLFTIY